ncbi:MAG: benzylsuccinate synthase beta subunit family protein [Syntrophobacteraceae bacterium]|nr:benzylsuccinate synthase beta subunit family protein [Syntrophobacteraceae bacterium]
MDTVAVESLLHHETGTSKPCKSCKWQVPDPTNPDQGQCTVNRTKMGSVWKRWVRDAQNMTCTKHEVGKLSFRDHV